MLDFKVIKDQTKYLISKLQEREAAISSIVQSKSIASIDLPNDVYDINTDKKPYEICDDLEDQFKQHSLASIQRRFPLLLNLKSTLYFLNKLNEISSISLRPTEVNNPDVLLQKQFEAARNLFSQKTYTLYIDTTNFANHTAKSIKYFLHEGYDINLLEQDSTITTFCKENIEHVKEGMEHSLFSALENKIYAEIANTCHEIAAIGIMVVDTELGYLSHIKKTPSSVSATELDQQATTLEEMAKSAQYYLQMSTEHLTAIQHRHNPTSLITNHVKPNYN